MAEQHLEDHSGTNAILVMLLVIAVLIFGFLIFRGGFGRTIPQSPNGANIQVQLPEGLGGGGDNTSGNEQNSEQAQP